MAQTLPFLLFEGVAECSNEFVQFLSMAAQEVLCLLHVLQAVVCRAGTQLNCQTEFRFRDVDQSASVLTSLLFSQNITIQKVSQTKNYCNKSV